MAAAPILVPVPRVPTLNPRDECDRPGHVDLAGIGIFAGDAEEALAHCVNAIWRRGGMRVATANLDFLALARRNPALRRDLNDSTLVVADGAPVAWLARLVSGQRIDRVAGVDLVQAILAAGHPRRTLRVALYGSTAPVSLRAANQMEQTYGGIEIVARLCPPFRPLNSQEQLWERDALAAVDPDVVLVALGCPRQERLIADYFDAAPTAVWIGVGGTLDFLAGERIRAPRLLQSAGLEWAWRLAQEPSRLWRRYVLRDIPELVRLFPLCAGAAARHLPHGAPKSWARTGGDRDEP